MYKKYRNETKYICSEQQLALIESRVKAICRRDAHAGERGMYTIRSVYFDDHENSCFYENENGTDPREKYRVRIYNGNTDYIMLECKRKNKNKNHKDSCPLTYRQCQAILDGTYPWALARKEMLEERQQTLLNRFFLLYNTRPLRPKIIVEYERTPYIYQVGNVRITFDRNISASRQTGAFLEPRISFRPVMAAGEHIMEVKYDELIPDSLFNAMQVRGIRQVAYSKYYVCRKFCG